MKFRINHTKVTSQANEIKQLARRMNSEILYLNQMEQDCRACWKGEAADAFLIKLNELRGEMEKNKKSIENLGKLIQNCADSIQREDEKAAKIAAALKTGN